MSPVNSKDLLVLENRSKEQHLEKLLASRTKPNIERLQSSVLQDVQRFLPLMQKANENLRQKSSEGNSSADGQRSDLSCEVGEDHEGPAIEMNLMFAAQEQFKLVAGLEAADRSEHSDSSMSEDSEEEEEDASSDEQQLEQQTKMKIVTEDKNGNVESSSADCSEQKVDSNGMSRRIHLLES